MSGAWALVRHSLRRSRTFLVSGALFLAVFQIFIILAARALHKSGAMAQLGGLMPNFLEQWTNMMALSFKGMVLFGYSHPLLELFLIAVAISIGTEPVGEIESKFVDLMMARPVPRTAAIARSIVVLLMITAGAMASMSIAQRIGLHLLTPAGAEPPAARVSLLLMINLAVLILAWGGITLAVASISKRRATAAAVCGFLAFAMFVLDYVGRFWTEIAPISKLSPFHYYSPFPLIGGTELPMADVAVLVAIFLLGSLIAVVAYARRDL